uniref:Gag-Pol polyprotein n=1 Tax=Tanacetum cinerariifolium TaxID=118510 RepID=A0A6L2NZE8_TANCI|nr:Gag-Pol polyprotein [Tanacetum cinerariifolium]
MSMTYVDNNTSGLVPQRQKVSDYDKSGPVPQLQNVSPSADTSASLQQELDLLFGLLYDEFFNADNAHVDDNEFINPFCTPIREVAESSSRNIDNLNIFNHKIPNTDGQKITRYLKYAEIHPSQCKQDDNLQPILKCEEVYVAQPDGFVDPDRPEKVYRLRKALYRLKQAPRAWTLDPPIPTRYLYQSGQFLGDKLVSWMSKKQDCTAMSSAEAEYMALSAGCAQVMWMRTQLKDYGFNYNKIPLYCDSRSAIAISWNPVQHSCTKHIHTRYHFIKERV